MGTWCWSSDFPTTTFQDQENMSGTETNLNESSKPYGYADDGHPLIGHPSIPNQDPWDEFRYDRQQLKLFKMAMQIDEAQIQEHLRAEEHERIRAEERAKIKDEIRVRIKADDRRDLIQQGRSRRRTNAVKQLIASSQASYDGEVIDLTSDIDDAPAASQSGPRKASTSMPHDPRLVTLGFDVAPPTPQPSNNKTSSVSARGKPMSLRKLQCVQIPPSSVNRKEFQYVDALTPPSTPTKKVSHDVIGNAVCTQPTAKSYATSLPFPLFNTTTPYTPTAKDPTKASDPNVAIELASSNITRAPLRRKRARIGLEPPKNAAPSSPDTTRPPGPQTRRKTTLKKQSNHSTTPSIPTRALRARRTATQGSVSIPALEFDSSSNDHDTEHMPIALKGSYWARMYYVHPEPPPTDVPIIRHRVALEKPPHGSTTDPEAKRSDSKTTRTRTTRCRAALENAADDSTLKSSSPATTSAAPPAHPLNSHLAALLSAWPPPPHITMPLTLPALTPALFDSPANRPLTDLVANILLELLVTPLPAPDTADIPSICPPSLFALTLSNTHPLLSALLAPDGFLAPYIALCYYNRYSTMHHRSFENLTDLEIAHPLSFSSLTALETTHLRSFKNLAALKTTLDRMEFRQSDLRGELHLCEREAEVLAQWVAELAGMEVRELVGRLKGVEGEGVKLNLTVGVNEEKGAKVRRAGGKGKGKAVETEEFEMRYWGQKEFEVDVVSLKGALGLLEWREFFEGVRAMGSS